MSNKIIKSKSDNHANKVGNVEVEPNTHFNDSDKSDLEEGLVEILRLQTKTDVFEEFNGQGFGSSGLELWNKLQRECTNDCSMDEVQKMYISAGEASNIVPIKVQRDVAMLSFDFWSYNNPVILLLLLEHMFVALDLHKFAHCNLLMIKNFFCLVYSKYNRCKYHNFDHCFCVTQMLYIILHDSNNKHKKLFEQVDVFALFLSAVCHDLGHPGTNNDFQVKTGSMYAKQFSSDSTLERFHYKLGKKILIRSKILNNMNEKTQREVHELVNRLILATDMARHKEILDEYSKELKISEEGHNKWNCNYIRTNPAHKHLLMMVLIKGCDISNETRPNSVTEPWVKCLLNEFFDQGDMEKQLGLPITPIMDRDTVVKSKSQTWFITNVSLPLFIKLNLTIDVTQMVNGLKANQKEYQLAADQFDRDN